MEYSINELSLDLLAPNPEDYYQKMKPTKILLVGKPGTGKTVTIKTILHAKRKLINQGILISGTEDTSGDFKTIFPPLFTYTSYSEDPINKLVAIQKQEIAKRVENPWSALVIDDCAYEKKFFTSSLQQQLFKNSRHWYILYLLSMQYAKDIPPTIRSTYDGVFLFREQNRDTRKILYQNYASIIPTFDIFNEIMDQTTTNYGSIFINNMNYSNDWQDCVFWYRPTPITTKWKFGCSDFWRYNDYYTE